MPGTIHRRKPPHVSEFNEMAPPTYGRKVWTRLDALVAAMPPEPEIEEHAWWVDRACQYDQQVCPKCEGLTQGLYVAPSDLLGECGVIESCRYCGWERVHISGRHGRPYARIS